MLLFDASQSRRFLVNTDLQAFGFLFRFNDLELVMLDLTLGGGEFAAPANQPRRGGVGTNDDRAVVLQHLSARGHES